MLIPSEWNVACCLVQIFWAPSSGGRQKAGIHPQGFLLPVPPLLCLSSATELIWMEMLKPWVQRTVEFGCRVVVGSLWIHWQRFRVIQGVFQRWHIANQWTDSRYCTTWFFCNFPSFSFYFGHFQVPVFSTLHVVASHRQIIHFASGTDIEVDKV